MLWSNKNTGKELASLPFLLTLHSSPPTPSTICPTAPALISRLLIFNLLGLQNICGSQFRCSGLWLHLSGFSIYQQKGPDGIKGFVSGLPTKSKLTAQTQSWFKAQKYHTVGEINRETEKFYLEKSLTHTHTHLFVNASSVEPSHTHSHARACIGHVKSHPMSMWKQ